MPQLFQHARMFLQIRGRGVFGLPVSKVGQSLVARRVEEPICVDRGGNPAKLPAKLLLLILRNLPKKINHWWYVLLKNFFI
jgi:hypothetical protein